MKNLSFKNIVFLAIGLAFLTGYSGCASLPQPGPTYFTHVVKWPGESISIVAGWYTGDVQNWKAIADVNPDINPNRMHEGLKIRIPENMMKTKTAMTKEYVDSYYPKPKRPPTKSSTPAPAKEKDEEPVLFGPKQYPAK